MSSFGTVFILTSAAAVSTSSGFSMGLSTHTLMVVMMVYPLWPVVLAPHCWSIFIVPQQALVVITYLSLECWNTGFKVVSESIWMMGIKVSILAPSFYIAPLSRLACIVLLSVVIHPCPCMPCSSSRFLIRMSWVLVTQHLTWMFVILSSIQGKIVYFLCLLLIMYPRFLWGWSEPWTADLPASKTWLNHCPNPQLDILKYIHIHAAKLDKI